MSQQSSPPTVIDKRCRVSSAHEAHQWTYQAYADELVAHGYPAPKRLDLEQVYSCPGVEHVSHDERCCSIHGTHALFLHVGCVLR